MDVAEIGRSYAVGWGTLALINAGLAKSQGPQPAGVVSGLSAVRPHRHLPHCHHGRAEEGRLMH